IANRASVEPSAKDGSVPGIFVEYIAADADLDRSHGTPARAGRGHEKAGPRCCRHAGLSPCIPITWWADVPTTFAEKHCNAMVSCNSIFRLPRKLPPTWRDARKIFMATWSSLATVQMDSLILAGWR